jgi:hypothetical protein
VISETVFCSQTGTVGSLESGSKGRANHTISLPFLNHTYCDIRIFRANMILSP